MKCIFLVAFLVTGIGLQPQEVQPETWSSVEVLQHAHSNLAYGPMGEPNGGGYSLAYGPMMEPNGGDYSLAYGPMMEPNGGGYSLAYGPMMEPNGLLSSEFSNRTMVRPRSRFLPC